MSLLVRIDEYLHLTKVSPTRFGRLAVNDPRLIGDMRRGRELGSGTRARVEAVLSEYHA